MQVWALYYGGGTYATDPIRDLERFPSITAAVQAFRARMSGEYVDFLYVHSAPEYGVRAYAESDATMLLWPADRPYDPEAYPAWRLYVGPRGGVVRERC